MARPADSIAAVKIVSVIVSTPLVALFRTIEISIARTFGMLGLCGRTLMLVLALFPAMSQASSCLLRTAPEVADSLAEGDSAALVAAIDALNETASDPDPVRAAPWRMAQAWMLLNLGRIDDAEPLLRDAIRGWSQSNRSDAEICARRILVWGLSTHARNEEALAESVEAETRAEAAGLEKELARLRQFRVSLLIKINERLGEARELLQKIPPSEDPRDRLPWHDSRGHILSVFGHHELAAYEFERVIELAEPANLPSARAAGRAHLASALSKRKYHDQPAQRHRIIDLLQQAHQDPDASAVTRAIALRMHSGYLPFDQRKALLEQCIKVAQGAGTEKERAVCMADLAEILVARDPRQASEWIDQAVKIAADNPRALWEIQRQRLAFIWHTLPPDEAFDASLQALEGERRLREAQLNGPERAEIINGLMWDYRRVVRYAYEHAYAFVQSGHSTEADVLAARAFSLMEANRALVLRERQQQEGQKTNAEREATNPLAEVDLKAIQAALAPDEALLSFLTRLPGEAHEAPGWLHVITAQRHWLHRVLSDRQLRTAAELLQGIMDWRDPAARRFLARLGKDLLHPLMAALPDRIHRLVIIHDTGLDQVPLEALPLADGRPLGTAYELNLVPAAAVWLRARSLHGQAGGGLVLADPHLPRAGHQALLDSTLDAPLPALPGTRLEGEFMAKRAGFSGIKIFSGENATEHQIKNLPAASTRLIHFGTHALVDPEHSKHSAVLLAAGNGDDGLLQASEIESLDLTGMVAVLASCASATGQWLDTEGVLGLARSFMIAGAPAVIATRWPVSDHAAAAYFTRMYLYLGRGTSLDQAMRQARADLADAGFPPRAWSAYVLIGDGAGKPLAIKPRWPGVLLIALALGLLAAAIGRARTDRRA